MPMKLLSADDFRDAAKDGGHPDGTVFRFATVEPETVDGAERTKRFIFSDATVDHAGDSIDPKGWDLSVFRRNPVALFSHMSWEPPIGRASNVKVESGKLVGDIEFASADIYPFADTIYNLVAAGYLKAVSVGFKPKEWTFTNDKDRPYGIDFKKQTLLEISVCAVPCNPNALGEARSAGIDTAPLMEWAEKVLDSGDTVFLPRKELEGLRAQASEHPAPRYYVHSSKTLHPDAAKHIREAVQRWQDDPNEVLILESGFELRTIGDAAHQQESEVEALDDAVVGPLLLKIDAADLRAEIAEVIKAGRRVSAATKAKLQEAMDHHEATAKCIKDLMDGDGTDDEQDPNDPTEQPIGTVVTESDDNLSPEELRLKEVRALRETLPTND